MGKRFRKGETDGREGGGGGGGGGGRLNEEELKALAHKTSFSLANVKDFHEGFMNDCPDGRMSEEKMKEMFATTVAKSKGGSGNQFVEQLFRVFDKNGDGGIDFNEFLIATDMCSSNDPEEKLRWAFCMYDQDNSGAISPEEMVEIFTLMYSVQGSSEEDAVEQARKVFAALDVDKDGKIGLEEFITVGGELLK